MKVTSHVVPSFSPLERILPAGRIVLSLVIFLHTVPGTWQGTVDQQQHTKNDV